MLASSARLASAVEVSLFVMFVVLSMGLAGRRSDGATTTGGRADGGQAAGHQRPRRRLGDGRERDVVQRELAGVGRVDVARAQRARRAVELVELVVLEASDIDRAGGAR